MARDLTALLDCSGVGSHNVKWLVLSLRALLRKPFLTGECDDALNYVDPGSLTTKKRKQS